MRQALGELVFRENKGTPGEGRWYLNPPFAAEDAPEGSKWVQCPDATRKEQKAEAQAWRAKYVATMVRLGAESVASAPQTVNRYEQLWIAERKRRGLHTTGSDHGRFMKWISPKIGNKPIATITRRDIEDVAESLDVATQEKRIGGKTARNIFGVLTKMTKDACTSRSGSVLRVREDNPAANVLPPAKGIEREGPYLYPADFTALLECPRVPLRWKRLITFAVYLMPRRGEQEAIEWGSVNEAQGYVHIHQAIDSVTRKVKEVKTGHNRKVRIPPTLLPMLAAMRAESKGEGKVFASMPPDEEMASRLRKYLEWAGVKRDALFADDLSRRPVSWHDLRHTGACWRIMRGDSSKIVQRAGGWRTAAMLDRYVNEAESFEDVSTFGIPFPEVGPAVHQIALETTDDPTVILPIDLNTEVSLIANDHSNPLGDASKPPERTGFFGETVGSVGSTVGCPRGSFPTAPTVDPTALSAALVAAAAAGDLDLVRRIVTLLEGSKS